MKNVMRNGKTKYAQNEKNALLNYMRSFEPFAVAGLIHDSVSDKRLKEENLGFTDGDFCWSSQNIYDIEKYNFAVSDDFLRTVL